MSACTPEEPRPAHPARQVGQDKPELSGTVALPSGDGRVYVITAPDGLVVEQSTCMLHVSQDGAHSSMACTPPSVHMPKVN